MSPAWSLVVWLLESLAIVGLAVAAAAIVARLRRFRKTIVFAARRWPRPSGGSTPSASGWRRSSFNWRRPAANPDAPPMGRLHLRRRRGLRPQPDDRRTVGLRGGDASRRKTLGSARRHRPTRSEISRPAPRFSASTATTGRPTAGRSSTSAPARPSTTTATIWRSSARSSHTGREDEGSGIEDRDHAVADRAASATQLRLIHGKPGECHSFSPASAAPSAGCRRCGSIPARPACRCGPSPGTP